MYNKYFWFDEEIRYIEYNNTEGVIQLIGIQNGRTVIVVEIEDTKMDFATYTDEDLITYLLNIYPEQFKEVAMHD
jgi:hypothetical protein